MFTDWLSTQLAFPISPVTPQLPLLIPALLPKVLKLGVEHSSPLFNLVILCLVVLKFHCYCQRLQKYLTPVQIKKFKNPHVCLKPQICTSNSSWMFLQVGWPKLNSLSSPRLLYSLLPFPHLMTTLSFPVPQFKSLEVIFDSSFHTTYLKPPGNFIVLS